MNNTTLVKAYIIIAFTVFLVSMIIALYRKKDMSFKIFALSFACHTIGSVLIPLQRMNNFCFSPVIANFIFFLGILLLFSGIRCFHKESNIWPNYFWIYLIVCLFASVIFTHVHYSFIARIGIFNVLCILLFFQLFYYIKLRSPSMPKNSRSIFCILIFGNIIMFMFRTIMLFIVADSKDLLFHNNSILIFTFIYGVIFLISWLTAYILLDNSILLDGMQKKNSLLETLNQRDSLTGLYNRNYYNQVKGDLLKISNHFEKPASLIFFDIDYFKKVNDEYGHAVGDQVLIHTAKLIKDNIRETDLAIRWGGEEFIILLLSSSLDGAVHLAENIRIAIQSEHYDTIGHLTASFGVAEYIKGESDDMWLKRADYALYEAKNTGRNRVVSWSESDHLLNSR